MFGAKNFIVEIRFYINNSHEKLFTIFNIAKLELLASLSVQFVVLVAR